MDNIARAIWNAEAVIIKWKQSNAATDAIGARPAEIEMLLHCVKMLRAAQQEMNKSGALIEDLLREKMPAIERYRCEGKDQPGGITRGRTYEAAYVARMLVATRANLNEAEVIRVCVFEVERMTARDFLLRQNEVRKFSAAKRSEKKARQSENQLAIDVDRIAAKP
jgi:hypothetical protein